MKHLITQDGSSHLYTATVTSDLIFHRKTSPYHPFYTVRKLMPNWTATVIMAGSSAIAGANRAEPVMMTLCLLTGFFGFHYALRALNAGTWTYTAVANLMFQSWFLWSGFYNFYLGMALMPFAIGYYIGHRNEFTNRRVLGLAGVVLGISLTHLVPALLTLMILGILVIWEQLFAETRRAMKQLLLLAGAASPSVVLIAIFAIRSKEKVAFVPGIAEAFRTFPQIIFAIARGRVNEQTFLWPAVLFFVVIAVFTLQRTEWRGPRGGLVAAAFVTFGLYLMLPDDGFGGSAVKMRFSWGVFLLGSLVACSAGRMRPLLPAVTFYLTPFLIAHLISIQDLARRTSDAAEMYLSVADSLPPGARFLRMHYAIPNTASGFGVNLYAIDILLHLDALAAVRRHAVDLSDYQAATRTFTVDYKDTIDEGQRSTLWAMNYPGMEGGKNLKWLRGGLPLQYLLLVGEAGPSDSDFPAVLAELHANAALVKGNSFVRLYKLN